MTDTLFLVFFAGVGVWACRRPVRALGLWAFTLSFQQDWSTILEGLGGLKDISMSAAILVVCASAIHWRGVASAWTNRMVRVVLWTCVLSLLALLAVARWNGPVYFGDQMSAAYQHIVPLFTLLFVLAIPKTATDVGHLVKAYCAGQFVIVGLTVLAFLGVSLPGAMGDVLYRASADALRGTGGFYDPNIFATAILPLGAFGMALMSKSRGISRIGGAGITYAAITGIIVSGSLAGYLALGGMLIVSLVMTKHRLKIALVAGGMFLVWWYFFGASIINSTAERISSRVATQGYLKGEFLSDHGRLDAWGTWIRIGLSNPLGVGVNYLSDRGITETLSGRLGRTIGPHNVWLGIWMEMGLLAVWCAGVVAFYSITAAAATEKSARHAGREVAIVARFGTLTLCGLGFATMTQEAYLYKTVWIALAIPLSLQASLVRLRRPTIKRRTACL